jgi:NAD(P)-dependent dehydrogenase (short-subunit alcohol dehydrogenase family)
LEAPVTTATFPVKSVIGQLLSAIFVCDPISAKGDVALETQLVAMTPLGRLGQPQDIARVAVFLASDEASWLTGA